MQQDELAEAIARLIHRPALDEAPNLDGDRRIFGKRRGSAAAGRRPLRGRGSGQIWIRCGAHITHRGLRSVSTGVYSLPHPARLLTGRIVESTILRLPVCYWRLVA